MSENPQFQVRMDDISKTRIADAEAAPLKNGEIRVAIDRFAFTANNITYGVVGHRIGYWKFFPAAGAESDGWGVIPVWGFADVVESKADGVAAGERLYGYFPTGPSLVMEPAKVKESRLVDGAAHRAELPPVYNAYARVAAQAGYDAAMDDERMLLYPLYATSFCLYDFLLDNDWFGAEQVVIVSASSKTSIGLAYALADDNNAPKQIGLTSPRNKDFVTGLGLYDAVATYDALSDIDASKPTVIIDMSGNGDVLAGLHRHLGDNMKYTSNVGVTHWEDNEMGEGFIRERSAMFFAPGHIQKRTKEWGPGVFEQKAFDFWRTASIRSRDWLKLNRIDGLEGLADVYDNVRNGAFSPSEGLIVSL